LTLEESLVGFGVRLTLLAPEQCDDLDEQGLTLLRERAETFARLTPGQRYILGV
jgi:hypothetical protein